MQIQGELVRATVTAKQRFNEAAYFFDGMQANQTNMTVFPYQLSAFLNAFRSITFYLQKQYARADLRGQHKSQISYPRAFMRTQLILSLGKSR